MAVHVGIDFGTTNTALALAEDDGQVALADLPGTSSGDAATTAKTWRTVLHFDPDAPPLAGAPAIARYVRDEGQGRLIQSARTRSGNQLSGVRITSAGLPRSMLSGKGFGISLTVSEAEAWRGRSGTAQFPSGW